MTWKILSDGFQIPYSHNMVENMANATNENKAPWIHFYWSYLYQEVAPY